MAKKKVRRRGRRGVKRGFASWSLGAKIGSVIGGTLVLLFTCGIAILAVQMSKIDHQKINPSKLSISTESEEHQTGFVNFALFGLDSREGELGKGVRSDSIMIASLNLETKEVKLVSVFRDTLLEHADGSYNKANAAYSFGGPEEAIALLNRNLDLNIQNYVSVNFNALVSVIDALGGIDIEVEPDEVDFLNDYTVETSMVVGQERVPIEGPGLQTLSGIQAVSYARIRYTAGGDYKRAERQRLVLQTIAQKAQTANLATINKIINDVFPQISTSLTLTDILNYAKDAFKYKVGEMSGFPFNQTSNTLQKVGSVGLADNLAADVTQLHQFLFGEVGYQPSEKVLSISNEIQYRTVNSVSTDTTTNTQNDDDDDSGSSNNNSYNNNSNSNSNNNYYDNDDDYSGSGNSSNNNNSNSNNNSNNNSSSQPDDSSSDNSSNNDNSGNTSDNGSSSSGNDNSQNNNTENE